MTLREALTEALATVDPWAADPTFTEAVGHILAALHDAGYALTPLAPEVPPRPSETPHVFEPLPRSKDGSQHIYCPRCGATRWVRAAGEPLGPCLAATRTPEPPDSGPHNPWASPSSEFDRAEDVLAGMLALQRLRGRLSKVTVSDVRTLLAAIPQPRVRTEPPDSGDGAARSRSVIRRENVQAGRPMNEGIEPPDSGDGARCRDLGYEAHAWVNTGSPSICRDCGMTFPRFDRLRLRSGSPAPEGGE